MIGALSFAKAGAYHMGLIRLYFGWSETALSEGPTFPSGLVGPRDERLATGGHSGGLPALSPFPATCIIHYQA